MATEKWIAGSGVGLTWTQIFNSGASLNSMAALSSVMDNADITNGTALDIYADLSIQLGSAAFAAPNKIDVFLYPLNGDGSTYGDGQVITTAGGSAKTPQPQYYVGSIVIPAATQAAEGMLQRIVMPPGTFRFVLQHNAAASGGAALASSGNAVQYRTYNRSVA